MKVTLKVESIYLLKPKNILHNEGPGLNINVGLLKSLSICQALAGLIKNCAFKYKQRGN